MKNREYNSFISQIEKDKIYSEYTVNNGHRYHKNGWIYVSITGNAKDRGFAYGQLIATEYINAIETLKFSTLEEYGIDWKDLVKYADNFYVSKIKEYSAEQYTELNAIANGINKRIKELTKTNENITSLEEVVCWNNIISILGYSYPHHNNTHGRAREGCSAFMSIGTCNEDPSNIVCAHNNFSEYLDGQFANQILSIIPSEAGSSNILMQGFVGYTWSGTDFFVTSSGIIGTETTIGGFNAYEHNVPISCRIRKAMQYGKSLDDYKKILIEKNSGDYANSWLFGDINKKEIMKLELGLKYVLDERKTDGYFIGFNAPVDPKIRNLECSNTGYNDIRRHNGSRKVRLEQLMTIHNGKINTEIAKLIISDHHDVYLEKDDCPNSRTVCAHYDLDAREFMSDPTRPMPYQPRGALDGNIVDSNMAREMSFLVKFGSSCDSHSFNAEEFCKKNIQWKQYAPYLRDRPNLPWTQFSLNLKGEKTPLKGGKTHKNKKKVIIN